MEEARSEMEFLPDEVLLTIFRYLGFKDLQLAEQVCERWKAVVKTHFATIKRLDLTYSLEESECVEVVKRCGPSLQALFMSKWIVGHKFNWIVYIAEAFPNLKSVSLQNLYIKNEDFRTLSMKCSQLKSISLYGCTVSDEGLGLLLQGLPGLLYFKISQINLERYWGECFSNLIGNLEYLNVTCWGMKITKVGLSHLFSKCKKVKTLELSGNYGCDELFSNWCRENVSVKKLLIQFNSKITKMSFSQISCLSLLEDLVLSDCATVDSDTLIDISRGCLNLRCVSLCYLPNICGRGVKSLSGCRNLGEFYCSSCDGVTEESLIELSKSGSLKRMTINNDSRISNISCAAILGHCPQLEALRVQSCRGVVDGIVDIAIEAIENRANGVVLHLNIWGTGVDQHKEFRTHPLLRVYRWVKDSFKSVDRITFE